MMFVVSVHTVPEDEPSMLAVFMFSMWRIFPTTFHTKLQDIV